jgi:exosortase family protein XrtG
MTILPWLAAILLWVAALAFFRSGRIWLPYYLTGSVGFAVGLVLLGQGPLGLERALEWATARGASHGAAALGIPTHVLPGATDATLVMVLHQPIGWTVLPVGVETSGLLEVATIAGLTLFYPLGGAARRAVLVAVGLAATAAANVVRVVVILAMLHLGGKETLFLAHNVVGRGIFFALVVGIYWLALTVPTVQHLREKSLEAR